MIYYIRKFVPYFRLVNLTRRHLLYRSLDWVYIRIFVRISIRCQRFDTKCKSWQLSLKSLDLDKLPSRWIAKPGSQLRSTNNTVSSLRYKQERRLQIAKWVQNLIFETDHLLSCTWVWRTPLPSELWVRDQAKIHKSHLWLL